MYREGGGGRPRHCHRYGPYLLSDFYSMALRDLRGALNWASIMMRDDEENSNMAVTAVFMQWLVFGNCGEHCLFESLFETFPIVSTSVEQKLISWTCTYFHCTYVTEIHS